MYEYSASTIPSCTVSEITNLLTKLYGGAVRAGLPMKEMPAAFLWGPPGVGKSDGVRQFCRQLEIEPAKRFQCGIFDCFCSPLSISGEFLSPIPREHSVIG